MSAYELVAPDIEDLLRSLTATLESSLQQGIEIGARVWCLPPWYARLIAREAEVRLGLVELVRGLRGWPRMVEVATVMGPFNVNSDVTWVIGKGFVGHLTRGCLPNKTPVDEAHIQHQTYWPPNLDDMTPTDWEAWPAEMRLKRSLADARRLKSLYGTAIGVRIPMPGGQRSGVGCLTVHTEAKSPLNSRQVKKAKDQCFPSPTRWLTSSVQLSV